MDTIKWCSILVLISGLSAQQCDSNHPTAFMCNSSVVQGHTVTLDASMAADIPFSKCSCSIEANVSGVIVTFDSYPQSSKCYTQMELRFQEKSVKFRCGAPLVAQTSSGASATIIYNLDTGATQPDSDYCLTFNSSSADTNLVLTCKEPDPSDALLLTTAPTSSTSTMTYSTSSSTPSTSTPNISSSSLTLPTNSSTSSAASPSSSMFTTTNRQDLPSSTPDLTTTAAQTTPFYTSTSTPASGKPRAVTNSTISSSTSEKAQTTNSNMTTKSVSFTTIVPINTTQSNTPTGIVNNVTTVVPNNTTSSNVIPSNVTASTAITNNVTSSTVITFNTTVIPNNLTSSTITPNNATSSTITPNNATSSTITPNNATSSTEIPNTPANSTVIPNNKTSSTLITTSTKTPDSASNSTVTPNNATSSTIAPNTTSTPLEPTNTTENSGNINETTVMPYNATTVMPSNTTDDNTSATTSVLTTASPDNTTNTTNSSTGVNMTVITTISPDNVTGDNSTANNETLVTTISPDNSTATADNSTVNNGTDMVTTRSPKTSTSSGFFEIPNEYDDPTETNSNLVIILPLVSILLVALVVGGTVIICKRSKRAARLQKERSKQIAKKPKPEKTSENPFLISNYHQVTENAKNDRDRESKEDRKGVTNKQTVDKYQEKEYNNTMKEKENGKLKDSKYLENNKNSTSDHPKKINDNKKAPDVYEPNDYEKDVLDNLELTSIVIEADPEDPNRYFKKTDPGDWYRVIMKGKKPKSEDDLGKTTDSKSAKKSSDKKKRHSKSGSDSKSDESSRDKSSDNVKTKTRTKHRHSLNNTSNSKTSIDSWDELDSDTDKPAPVPSGPQPRLVVSKPVAEPRVVQSANPPATTVIMSQPKPSPDTGGQKHVQMRAGSGSIGGANGGAAQTIRSASPANTRQSAIKSSPIKRPDIVPPLKL